MAIGHVESDIAAESRRISEADRGATEADVLEAARKFVHYYETWEQYKEMQGSISVALPIEFMELCEAVESFYGEPNNEG